MIIINVKMNEEAIPMGQVFGFFLGTYERRAFFEKANAYMPDRFCDN